MRQKQISSDREDTAYCQQKSYCIPAPQPSYPTPSTSPDLNDQRDPKEDKITYNSFTGDYDCYLIRIVSVFK